MFFPKTPTKADQGFIAIIRSLNVEEGLQLPIREGSWSPARDSRLERVEEQIVSRLKFLFFKHKGALYYVLDLFKKRALEVHSQWQFKPLADPDLLPTRPAAESALRRDFLRKRPYFSDEVVAELTQSLLRFVSDVADEVKSNANYAAPKLLRGTVKSNSWENWVY